MSYSLVVDPSAVQEFAKRFLNHEGSNLLYLAGRRKYDPEMGNNGCLKRVPVTEQSLLCNIYHYEVPLGTLYNQTTKRSLSQKSLSVYCSVNERDVKGAIKKMCIECLKDAFDNTYSLKKAKIQHHLQVCAKKRYVTLDLDDKKQGEQVYTLLKQHISEFVAIETHGGYHFIFERALLKTRDKQGSIYKALTSIKGVDKLDNDGYSPVPGTLQGGFAVRFAPEYSWPHT